MLQPTSIPLSSTASTASSLWILPVEVHRDQVQEAKVAYSAVKMKKSRGSLLIKSLRH